MLASCSPHPNWMPRKPKLMLNICQKFRRLRCMPAPQGGRGTKLGAGAGFVKAGGTGSATGGWGRISPRRQTLAGHVVQLGRHVGDARGVYPCIVEVEQRADGDRVVQRLLRPTGPHRRLDVLRPDLVRRAVHLLDEGEQGAILFADRRSVEV